MRVYILVSLILLNLLTSGCAGLLRHEGPADPRDPWEGTNRAIFKFNESVDRTIFKPIAQGYEKTLPQPLRTGITNFFSNLGDLMTAIQHALQLDFRSSSESTVRFLVNSTVGILGFIDVATYLGFNEYEKEDYGQSLASFGVGPGCYIVLPVLGPSTARDTIASAIGVALKPTQGS